METSVLVMYSAKYWLTPFHHKVGNYRKCQQHFEYPTASTDSELEAISGQMFPNSNFEITYFTGLRKDFRVAR